MRKRIYLCLAHMSGNEMKFIQEAFDTNWVVPLGPNVNGFEKDLEEFVGEDKRVVALSSGTAAVHLGLLACGVGPGDEVLVQSFTFCASTHPITYLGATPVMIDSEPDTWNMDPELLEKAIIDRIEKTGKKPKAIVPVALYGMPYKADRIMEIANKYEIPVVEDAAEGFGSKAGLQFRAAKDKCSGNFKMFVWNPAGNSLAKYIKNIRRDIVENIIYSDRPSPVIFVEDLINVMNVRHADVIRHEPSDVFFIYNELDSDTAADIYNMLRDFLKVKRLALNMSSGTDYGTYISQQLSDSKIGVVYYNYAGDWAVPFARQIWKDSGGISSKSPLVVAGNSQHATSDELVGLKGIMECVVDGQMRIPLDIKVFLDKYYQK